MVKIRKQKTIVGHKTPKFGHSRQVLSSGLYGLPFPMVPPRRSLLGRVRSHKVIHFFTTDTLNMVDIYPRYILYAINWEIKFGRLRIRNVLGIKNSCHIAVMYWQRIQRQQKSVNPGSLFSTEVRTKPVPLGQKIRSLGIFSPTYGREFISNDKLVKGLGESHDSELKNLIPLLSRPQRRGSHALDYTFGIWLVQLVVGDPNLGSFQPGFTS